MTVTYDAHKVRYCPLCQQMFSPISGISHACRSLVARGGGILPDVDLLRRGHDLVYPFNAENVQPASIDLTLGAGFLRPIWGLTIDMDSVTHEELAAAYMLQPEHDGAVTLSPGEFVLATVAECVTLPADLVMEVAGKSSWARLGLSVHQTAGFIDPGFRGNVTLELKNVGSFHLVLRPGMKIAQAVFAHLTWRAARPYGSPGLGSHYAGQQGVTPPRR